MGAHGLFSAVRFLGDSTTLFVSINYTPVSSAGRLYDGKTGKLLAEIGGATQELDDSAVVELSKGVFAFGAFSGGKLFVYDAATGRSHPSLGLAAPKSEPQLGSMSLLARTADGAVVAAMRGDALSGVTLIDAKSRNGQRVPLPICK